MKIRIGTRGSKLARWQAEWVAGELEKRDVETELVYLKTLGDVKAGPIENVGAQGVFTKEIQRALIDDRVDLAVHSLKDLPTDHVEGLSLSAVPVREACGDVLVSITASALEELPKGAVIGTGSARRKAQLLAFRRDFEIRDLRGNVDTRIGKLHEGELHAIILAEAGLRRLGLEEHITQLIPRSIMLPAVGQGALGIETREADALTKSALAFMHDEETFHSVLAERSLLRTLRGGCITPIGAWARYQGTELKLDSIVLNSDGTKQVTATSTALPEQCEEIGIRTANELLSRGADLLLARE